MRLVDMHQRAAFQSLGVAVVLFLVHVLMGMIEQIKGAMKTAMEIEIGVNRRVVARIFAVID